uniref:Protein osiris 4 n=1 Tax=Glossina brevipalpis TaxID=37001 RepID=A0A1A9W5M0_9MUSC
MFKRMKTILTFYLLTLMLLLTGLQLHMISAEITSHSKAYGINSLQQKQNNHHHQRQQQQQHDSGQSSDFFSTLTKPSSSSSANIVNTDFVNKMSWTCINNASCLYTLANSLLSSYRRGEAVRLGLFDVVKLPPPNYKTKAKWSTNTSTGRSLSTFVDFISGNAIRIPVGPVMFSVQRAEDDADYIEIALLKKATVSQARLGGDGGGGGGGGGGGFLKKSKNKDEDKKEMQMYIPMYLAATTFGWTMLAVKAVSVLTLKALTLSKIAFVVAALVLIKKLMDNTSDKMVYHYPEHTPYMMPYSMDYSMHSMPAAPVDMAAAADMYAAGMPMHAAVSSLANSGGQGHSGLEHFSAESSLHPMSADVHNSTQVLAALNAVGLGQPAVKRTDSLLGRTTAARRPIIYNYLNPYKT